MLPIWHEVVLFYLPYYPIPATHLVMLVKSDNRTGQPFNIPGLGLVYSGTNETNTTNIKTRQA